MTNDLKILVLGIGNGGNHSVERMINYYPEQIEYWTLNADKQLLEISKVPNKLLLGENLTMGLGCGGDVDLGRKCAIESKKEIEKILFGADIVYLVSCLGGGTGTGAVSIIAEMAKRMGILTVSIVTFPFAFEGKYKLLYATEGLKELKKYTDAYIKIENQDILKIIDQKCSMQGAFSVVDEVIINTITSINDLMIIPGLINIDFDDIKDLLKNAREISVVRASADGENKTDNVIKKLLSSDTSLSQAKSLILNVTGDKNTTLNNVYEIANALNDKIPDSANIIFGCIIDEKLQDEIKVTLLWNSK